MTKEEALDLLYEAWDKIQGADTFRSLRDARLDFEALAEDLKRQGFNVVREEGSGSHVPKIE